MDYFDYSGHKGAEVSEAAGQAVFDLEIRLQVDIDVVGLAPEVLIERPNGGWRVQNGLAEMTNVNNDGQQRKVK